MIRAVTNSPSGWPIPENSEASVDHRVRMLTCGVEWDALRTPEKLALPVLARLLADADDCGQLGPVLRDERSSTVYWLVTTGHTATYPDGCLLRSTGAWLAVPNPINPHSKLAWLHLPARPAFTPPPWLAAAPETSKPTPIRTWGPHDQHSHLAPHLHLLRPAHRRHSAPTPPRPPRLRARRSGPPRLLRDAPHHAPHRSRDQRRGHNMTGHPDDEAFLDGLDFRSTYIRRCCDRCEHRAPTVVISHIEGSSGPGYEVRNCRPCIALYLARGRAQARSQGLVFVPSMPTASL